MDGRRPRATLFFGEPAHGALRARAVVSGIWRDTLRHFNSHRNAIGPASGLRGDVLVELGEELLGKLFGDGAGIWTRMQAAYDTWQAERTEDVSQIPTIKAKAA